MAYYTDRLYGHELSEELERLSHYESIADLDVEDPDCEDRIKAWEAEAGDEFDGDDLTSYRQLIELRDEVGTEAFECEVFVSEGRDFEDYAQELAEDLGLIPDGLGWPLNCIDWEMAARELAYDYTSVDFRGTTYLVRTC